MKYFLLSLFIILSGCAPIEYSSSSTSALSTPAATTGFCKPQIISTIEPQPDLTQTYIIKAGDSLWQLSRRFNVSSESIMRLNGVESSTDLTVGQKLIIPETNSSSKIVSFAWPTKGRIIEFYGEKIDNIPNSGLNIRTAISDVLASADGKVVFCDFINGWGKTLILKHNNNFYTVYANLALASVAQGAYVLKRSIIGSVLAGDGKNNVLHFEIRKQYYPQNPLKYLQ
jgi:lipoprotein YgeR